MIVFLAPLITCIPILLSPLIIKVFVHSLAHNHMQAYTHLAWERNTSIRSKLLDRDIIFFHCNLKDLMTQAAFQFCVTLLVSKLVFVYYHLYI